MDKETQPATVHGVTKESDPPKQLNNNSTSGNPGLIITPDPLRSNTGKCLLEDFPGGPVVKTVLPMQGAHVQFLVGEPRSHMLNDQKENKTGHLLACGTWF